MSFFFADARATVRIFLNATVTVTLLMCLLSARQSETRVARVCGRRTERRTMCTNRPRRRIAYRSRKLSFVKDVCLPCLCECDLCEQGKNWAIAFQWRRKPVALLCVGRRAMSAAYQSNILSSQIVG